MKVARTHCPHPDNGKNCTLHATNVLRHRSSKLLFNGQTGFSFARSYTPPISIMPKVFIFSPALITRRKISRVEYIVSYKETRSIRSKPTLLLQCQRKLRHERPMLTLESSRSDIPSTKAKVLVDRTNASHRDTDLNPHWWSPTIQRRRRRRQSPAPISFQLSSRKTSLQTKDQPNDLQPFLSGQDKASSKPSCKEVIFRQQPRLLSDSAPLRVWIACIIFGFALRDNQPQPPECVVFISFNTYHLSECRVGIWKP